jgi:hypothetical protein
LLPSRPHSSLPFGFGSRFSGSTPGLGLDMRVWGRRRGGSLDTRRVSARQTRVVVSQEVYR